MSFGKRTMTYDDHEEYTRASRNKKQRTTSGAQGIAEPHKHDILCGRGGLVNSFPGNVAYRRVVESNKKEYHSAPKSRKGLISRSIVEAIARQDPPGRFIQKDKATGLWYDIGIEKSIQKTSQALREDFRDKKKDESEDEESEHEEEEDAPAEEDHQISPEGLPRPHVTWASSQRSISGGSGPVIDNLAEMLSGEPAPYPYEQQAPAPYYYEQPQGYYPVNVPPPPELNYQVSDLTYASHGPPLNVNTTRAHEPATGGGYDDETVRSNFTFDLATLQREDGDSVHDMLRGVPM